MTPVKATIRRTDLRGRTRSVEKFRALFVAPSVTAANAAPAAGSRAR